MSQITRPRLEVEDTPPIAPALTVDAALEEQRLRAKGDELTRAMGHLPGDLLELLKDAGADPCWWSRKRELDLRRYALDWDLEALAIARAQLAARRMSDAYPTADTAERGGVRG